MRVTVDSPTASFCCGVAASFGVSCISFVGELMAHVKLAIIINKTLMADIKIFSLLSMLGIYLISFVLSATFQIIWFFLPIL